MSSISKILNDQYHGVGSDLYDPFDVKVALGPIVAKIIVSRINPAKQCEGKQHNNDSNASDNSSDIDVYSPYKYVHLRILSEK